MAFHCYLLEIEAEATGILTAAATRVRAQNYYRHQLFLFGARNPLHRFTTNAGAVSPPSSASVQTTSLLLNHLLSPPICVTPDSLFSPLLHQSCIIIFRQEKKKKKEIKRMSLSRHLFRRAPHVLNPYQFREFSSTTRDSHHKDHQRIHEYLQPSNYLNSWETPRNPKEAQWKLSLLRSEYAKQVKTVRKEYIREMELQKLEKLKKDEARKEALRIANEERKTAKAAEKKAKAKEREIAEEEFRQTLMKERAEKLEYWRMRTQQTKEKEAKKRERLHQMSSEWIEESDLLKKILDTTMNITPLCPGSRETGDFF